MSSVPLPTRVTSDLDPFSPEFRADPFTPYQQLRDLNTPIVWLTRHSIWTVSRYEPVRAALSDPKRFSNAVAQPQTISLDCLFVEE